jgi:hypothetical protein
MSKNPLYVVKGKTVLEAKNVFDLVIKKFNLEPVVKILESLLKMILEQVQSYHVLEMVTRLMDEWIEKLSALNDKFTKKA